MNLFAINGQGINEGRGVPVVYGAAIFIGRAQVAIGLRHFGTARFTGRGRMRAAGTTNSLSEDAPGQGTLQPLNDREMVKEPRHGRIVKLGAFSQHPAEREKYTVNYRNDMTGADRLINATILVDPPGLVVDNITVAQPRVRLWVQGGTAGVSYKVSIIVDTSSGRRMEDTFIMKIKDL